MTIADQTDIEALLQRALSATEAGYLPVLLARADGLIAEHLPGVTFDGVVAGETVTLTPQRGTTELWLPLTPVNAVNSVTLDGALLDPDGYDWHKFGDIARVPDGNLWAAHVAVEIDWDYGLAAPPPAVVAVAADMVHWAVTNPTGVRQESVGSGYGVTYDVATVAGVMLTADHKKILNGYRYPVAI